jgi:hypothetical protein
MTVRQRGYIFVIVTPMAQLALMYGALFVSPYLAVPAAILFIASAIVSWRWRCPRCGRPIFKHKANGFDVWGSWIARQCEQCGLRFDQKFSQVGPSSPER